MSGFQEPEDKPITPPSYRTTLIVLVLALLGAAYMMVRCSLERW
jgi:hypothetical protein